MTRPYRQVLLGLLFPFLSAFSCLLLFQQEVAGQIRDSYDLFSIGEKISYELSFGRFRDVGHAEVAVASKGTVSGRPAVELRSRVRTYGVVGAAFLPLDEERITIASAESGLPMLSRKISDPRGLAEESSVDFTKNSEGQYDLLTLIYYLRRTGGLGTAIVAGPAGALPINFRTDRTASIETPAGRFETDEVVADGDALREYGFSKVIVYLTRDEKRLPVAFKITTEKGEFRAEATAIFEPAPPGPEPASTPANVPVQKPSPKPLPTPEQYIPNQPLSDDLPFTIGETLEYRITAAGKPVGTVVLRVRERTKVDGRDSLVLSATVTNAVAGNPVLALNDAITEYVDPLTLAPFRSEMKFTGGLAGLSRSITFDRSGAAIFGGRRIDVPFGTHAILSLLYAVRGFNLTPVKTADSRVNDTRVAAFWNDSPLVFTLHPGKVESLEIAGKRISAQQITITTGDADLDRTGIKIWLSPDGQRLPLRISIGVYQADLFSTAVVMPAQP